MEEKMMETNLLATWSDNSASGFIMYFWSRRFVLNQIPIQFQNRDEKL